MEKVMKKYGLLLVFGALGFSAYSAPLRSCSWTANVRGTEAHATHCAALKGWTLPLHGEGEGVRIVSWKAAPFGKDIWVLTYDLPEVGSQMRVRTQRQVVVNVRNRKVLVDAQYKVWDVSSGKPLERDLQPRWLWAEDGFRVENLPYGEEGFEYRFADERKADQGRPE